MVSLFPRSSSVPSSSPPPDQSLLHVLGCEGERDVISQLVRVRLVRLIGGGDDNDGTDDERGNRLAIRDDLPGSALPLQRFYLVNADRRLLDEGEFYHDVNKRTVYARPPLITAPDLEDLLLRKRAPPHPSWTSSCAYRARATLQYRT